MPATRAQAGAALLIILVLLIVGGAYAALTGLNAATADVKLRREQTNAAVLRQAKDALIAWSAMHATEGPGHLPCPDRLNNGSTVGPVCGTVNTRIGRLPWITLGLPDLRDASGERLWYVVSGNFVDRNDRVVNSDTPGTLQVTGVAPAANVLAIIFAPGAIVAKADGTLQIRAGATPCAVATDALCNPENYLERENANVPANDIYVAIQRCLQNEWGCGDAFNDELIVITHEDLFSIVEPIVARRIETEVGKELRDYYAAWNTASGGNGFYPFAVPFDAAPTPIPVANAAVALAAYQNQFFGRIGQTNGLMPMTADTVNAAGVKWTGAPTQSASDPARVTAFDCSDFDAMRARCVLTYTAGPALTVTISGAIQNVANALFLPIMPTDPVSGVRVGGVTLAAPHTFTQAVDPSTARLNATVTLNIAAALLPATIEIVIPAPQPNKLVADASFDWFRRNYWYSQVYYAMHPRFGAFASPKPLSAAANSCASAPMPTPCMTLRTTSGTQNDVAVIAVLAGRDRAGATPRGWAFAQYFEGENLSSPMSVIADPAIDPDYAFESGLRSPTFNDRAAVVARRP